MTTSSWAKDQRGREESLDPDRQPASPGRPHRHRPLCPSLSFSIHVFLPSALLSWEGIKSSAIHSFAFGWLCMFLPSGAWQKIAQAENETPLIPEDPRARQSLRSRLGCPSLESVPNGMWPYMTRASERSSAPGGRRKAVSFHHIKCSQKCWPHRGGRINKPDSWMWLRDHRFINNVQEMFKDSYSVFLIKKYYDILDI